MFDLSLRLAFWLNKFLQLFVFCFFLTACPLKKSEWIGYFIKSSCERAFNQARKKNFKLKGYEKALNQCWSENKTEKAFFIMERLLKLAKKKALVDEIKKWEKALAEGAYKNKNYEKALKHYTELLNQPLGETQRFSSQYHIAKSYFYLGKHSQALREVEKGFFKKITKEQRKKALILKGRIFIANKQLGLAQGFFNKQIQNFPEDEALFREYLAFIHESNNDFLSALEELKKIQPSSPLIRQKILRLTERWRKQTGL